MDPHPHGMRPSQLCAQLYAKQKEAPKNGWAPVEITESQFQQIDAIANGLKTYLDLGYLHFKRPNMLCETFSPIDLPRKLIST